MRVLGLETSEYVSGVALFADGELVAEQTFASRMNLCETLTVRLQALLGTDLACDAGLTAIAVSQGPGSFTGLRVGMATAKALAHACEAPLVGVPTQEVLAAGAEALAGERLYVLQKARQGHVYAGLWEKTETGAKALKPVQVVPVEELPEYAGERCVVIGPSAEVAAEMLERLPEGTTVQMTMPQAQVVARLGAGRVETAHPQAAYNLQPLYMLASQAERMKNLDLSAPRRQVRLRTAELGDLSDVVRLENISFSSPWPEVSIREELARREGGAFLAVELDGKLAGYAGAWIFAGEAHICTIAVDPEQRRQGLAELLMLGLLRRAQDFRVEYALLEYRVTNCPAAELYRKLGFTYVHTRKRYYADNNEDAVVVALPDLGTNERKQYLDGLLASWQERHGHELQLEI